MYTSPILQHPKDRVLHECPIGLILRDAPHIYDIIDRCALTENASPGEFAASPRYLQHASRLVGSERARLREMRDLQRKAERDARYGSGVRRHHG